MKYNKIWVEHFFKLHPIIKLKFTFMMLIKTLKLLLKLIIGNFS